ncbi:hypothetical protein BaRGS_00020204 [Batillaria attramentaria]|uniref:Uncharacterized protein n=1 Tax=Batillaria attramentaria TaxID=370345 RepID=A0ABD0KNA1_9CAEN
MRVSDMTPRVAAALIRLCGPPRSAPITGTPPPPPNNEVLRMCSHAARAWTLATLRNVGHPVWRKVLCIVSGGLLKDNTLAKTHHLVSNTEPLRSP